MEYGIQHRSIYLTPLGDQIEWLAHQLDQEDVWQMFGFEGPMGDAVRQGHAKADMVLGVIRRVRDRQRIGFVMCTPLVLFNAWELGVAISDPKDRDAWSAIHAMDAFAHYVVEHLGITTVMARVKEKNRASIAMIQRLGYSQFNTSEIKGERCRMYSFSVSAWERRRAKLDRAEQDRPSGIGATFVMLEGPPFEPKA
jgi:RimJ/RimL family protein N-acetyltransferase